MSWVALGSPVPHDTRQNYAPFAWPVGDVEQLVKPNLAIQSFVDVLGARRSQRTFGPLTVRDLSSLLWLSCREISSWESGFGYALSLRPVPSAGAIHCIHVLIGTADGSHWRRYDPINHVLVTVTGNDTANADLRANVGELLDPMDGMIVQLVAEPGKVAAKYENPSSLIWRDAGAVIAHLGLAASYLGLHCCALGIDGNAWASMLDPGRRLAGVGVVLIGSPT